MSLERVLTLLMSETDFFKPDSPQKNIAELGISIGFENLSDEQKEILSPFLNKPCEGVDLPSGDHVSCGKVVIGEDMVQSLLNKTRHNAFLCSDCLSRREPLLQQLECLDCLPL